MAGMTLHMRAGAPAGPVALFAAGIVIAAALIVGRQADAAGAEALGWTAGEIHGEARIRTGDAPWKALRPGTAVLANSEIETGPASRVRLTGPGGTVTALPNSGLVFRSAADAAGKGPRIVQRRGSLQFAIAMAPDRPLRIETPFLTAAIQDAAVTISVNARNTALYVAGGVARVTSVLTGEAAVVRPEYMAWVNAPSGGRLKTIAIRPRAAPPVSQPRKSPARVPRIGPGGKALAGFPTVRPRS